MKGLFYKTKVYESNLDFVHGFATTIREIWIPELKLCINDKHGAFESAVPRAKPDACTETDVSDEVAGAALDLIKARDEFEQLNLDLFNRLGGISVVG